ncbi:MAG: dTMP kinase [Cellulomonadaceae bacterium]|jgi:dTMP kinase|nr:dTMP kinase [Cellulomonadaceae bacterium]
MNNSGLFITLEGCDKSGKSTQAGLLADWLRAGAGPDGGSRGGTDDKGSAGVGFGVGSGREVLLTREPGGSDLGKVLRNLVQHGEHLDERTEALLYAADRAHHVATVIRPALARGAIVICDRYSDSSIAYQGGGRSLVPDEVAWISRWATNDLVPDITILFDADPALTAARRTDEPADRIESAGLELQAAVRQAYLALAAAEPQRWHVINAEAPIETIAAQVKAAIHPLLP